VLAALALSLHPTFVAQSRLGMMDTLVTLLVTAAGYCLWQASDERKRYCYLWGVACGCALLTKGGGAIYCLPVCLVYAAIAKPTLFKNAHFYGGLALSLLVPGIWFWNQWATHYEVFKMCYIDHEVNYRLQGHNVLSTFLLQKTTLKLWQSFGFLAPLCVMGSGLAFLGKPLRRGGWRCALFMPVFLVITMLLTNMVSQQMSWYILPGVVPLVVLSAGAVVMAIRRELPLWGSGVLALSLAVGLVWCRPDRVNLSSPRDGSALKRLATQVPDAGENATPLVVNFSSYHMNVALFYSRRDRAEQARGFVPEEGKTYYGILRKRALKKLKAMSVEVMDAKSSFALVRLRQAE
jgi:4-amino-4-deoxy-L-arabinose transferase-like glycosyltransferase